MSRLRLSAFICGSGEHRSPTRQSRRRAKVADAPKPLWRRRAAMATARRYGDGALESPCHRVACRRGVPPRVPAQAGKPVPAGRFGREGRGARRPAYNFIGVHLWPMSRLRLSAFICGSIEHRLESLCHQVGRAGLQAGKPVPPSGARRLASGKACVSREVWPGGTRGETPRLQLHRCSSVANVSAAFICVHLRFRRAQVADAPKPPTRQSRRRAKAAMATARWKACATKWGAQTCKREGLRQRAGSLALSGDLLVGERAVDDLQAIEQAAVVLGGGLRVHDRASGVHAYLEVVVGVGA